MEILHLVAIMVYLSVNNSATNPANSSAPANPLAPPCLTAPSACPSLSSSATFCSFQPRSRHPPHRNCYLHCVRAQHSRRLYWVTSQVIGRLVNTTRSTHLRFGGGRGECCCLSCGDYDYPEQYNSSSPSLQFLIRTQLPSKPRCGEIELHRKSNSHLAAFNMYFKVYITFHEFGDTCDELKTSRLRSQRKKKESIYCYFYQPRSFKISFLSFLL